MFHGGMDGSRNLLRLPLLPDKLKMGVVYGTRPFNQQDLDHLDGELKKKERDGQVALGRGDAVRSLLKAYFATPDVLESPDYSSQITKINYRLWPALFHPAAGFKQSSFTSIPDLLYLEIETIVSEAFQRFHKDNPQSLIHRLLFNADFRQSALRHFNDIPGAFSKEKDTGTFFFWGIDDHHHRMRLRFEDGFLVSPDGSFKAELTPEVIGKLLREKKIFPSMLLSYLMVSLYYGMKCLGGFCQVNDLTMAKDAWRCILLERGEEQEVEAIVPIQTKELGGDGMVLAYARSTVGDLVPATGIDLALETRDTSFEKYVARSKMVTLSEMMSSMLPEMYTVLYAANERDSALSSITPEEIMRGTGLQEKLLQESSIASARW
jgi:hypothetical protein